MKQVLFVASVIFIMTSCNRLTEEENNNINGSGSDHENQELLDLNNQMLALWDEYRSLPYAYSTVENSLDSKTTTYYQINTEDENAYSVYNDYVEPKDTTYNVKLQTFDEHFDYVQSAFLDNSFDEVDIDENKVSAIQYVISGEDTTQVGILVEYDPLYGFPTLIVDITSLYPFGFEVDSFELIEE